MSQQERMDPADISKVRETLEMLRNILEDYAPTWYVEEHRDKVGAALRAMKP